MCEYHKVDKYKIDNEKFYNLLQKENVSVVIQRYFKNYLVSVPSKRNYWSSIKNFLTWCIDFDYIQKKNISEINDTDLANLLQVDAVEYRTYLDERLSHSSVQIKIAELRAFWNYLVNCKIASDNIFSNLPKTGYKSFRKNVAKVPLPQDVFDMIDNVKSEKNDYKRNRDLTVIKVLQGTGLRRSELVALNKENVDFENHTLSVMGKGLYDRDDVDIIHISNEVVETFKEWYSFRSSYVPDDIEAIFVNKNGERMSCKAIERIVEKHSNGKITPHMLRHFYATILYQENKGNMVYVAQQMRHRRGVTDSYIDGSAVHF